MLKKEVKALAADEWTHVAFTRDGSEAALFLNGANKTSVGYSLTPGNGGYVLKVGGPSSFQGKIDDVRIYDQALDAEKIGQIATGEL